MKATSLLKFIRRKLLKVVMSRHTSDLRQLSSRRFPNLPGRRLHRVQLPDGVFPAALQSHVFLGATPRVSTFLNILFLLIPVCCSLLTFSGYQDLQEPFWSPFEEAILFVPSVETRYYYLPSFYLAEVGISCPCFIRFFVSCYLHLLFVLIGFCYFSYQLQPLLPSSSPVPLMRQNAQIHTREEGSKLSKIEQKQSLEKLRKETYKPKYMYTHTAKMISRVGQYYKGKPVTNDAEYNRNIDGDKCAICLEEFEPREEVTVTPCSHMFHDECITPWVRSNGQCPVCRSIFYERVQGSSRQSLGHMQGTPIRDADSIFAAELMSIVRAIEGGFQ